MPRRRSFARRILPSRGARPAAVAVAAIGLALPAAASAEVLQAPAASTYRDSVGVEMHSGFTGYSYDNDPVFALASRLRFLGIGHVRESACDATDAVCARPRSRVGELARTVDRGFLSAYADDSPALKFDFQVTPEIHAVPARADRDAVIERSLNALITPPLAGTVESIEENNEPDLEKVATWPQTVIGDDATIRRLLALPKYASLAGIPVLTPALGRPTATATLLAAGWNTAVGLTPNFHPYGPAWGGPENGPLVPCATGLLAIDCVKKLSTTGGAPIATESGYSTSGYVFSGQSWVTERAQGIYEPRILMENFSLGIKRTYLYELLDLKPDYSSVTNGWGLFRAKYYGSTLEVGGVKPAGMAISRLQSRIGDLGATDSPGSLDVSITDGAGNALAPAALHRQLLRRADGSYVLALWQPKAVFDNTMWKQHDTSVADLPVNVTVNSGVDGGWQATTFRPSVDGKATKAGGSRFTVPVGADVSLVDLRGTGQGTIPGGPFATR